MPKTKISPFDRLGGHSTELSRSLNPERSRRIKAVFFDLGGVLLGDDFSPFYRIAARFYGISPDEMRVAWHRHSAALQKGHASYASCLRVIGIHYGKKRISYNFLRRLANIYIKCAPPRPQVFQIAWRLKRSGIMVGIISNTHEQRTRINAQRGIFRGFDIVILSHRAGLMKPDPKIFWVALRKMNLSPAESIFIDDRKENVESAAKIGMREILFRNAADLRKRQRRLGVL